MILIPRFQKEKKNYQQHCYEMFCFQNNSLFLHQTVHFDGNFQSFQPSLTRLFTLSELSPQFFLTRSSLQVAEGFDSESQISLSHYHMPLLLRTKINNSILSSNTSFDRNVLAMLVQGTAVLTCPQFLCNKRKNCLPSQLFFM